MLIKLFISLFFLISASFYPAFSLSFPENIRAFDTPNDNGNSITLEWESPFNEGSISYNIFRSEEASGDFKVIGKKQADSAKYVDSKVKRGKSYYYMLQAKDKDGNIQNSLVIGPVIPIAQWFNRKLTSIAISIVIFAGTIVFCIYHARSGKSLFIRKIAGLDAIDEAIGRATEMGRSVLYVSGLGGIRSVPTIASLNILSRIAHKTAEYGTPLYVPGNDPVVVNIAKEVVQNAYLDAGHPEIYRSENIFFVSEEQFPYAAAVDGIIIREKPAAIFYLGVFMAESLILAEVGNSVGSVQVAGTDSITQLPFFITSCDYTLMGEELYAASAYLSKDPLLLGSLRGQDWGKLIVIVMIILGVILQLIGVGWFINLLKV
ncbi:hypothetical protein FJZ33_04660 [Candidatus Poribacteria bacterium]|nr:hypothetical protein [Candidatus Poribacteria bacterium]